MKETTALHVKLACASRGVMPLPQLPEATSTPARDGGHWLDLVLPGEVWASAAVRQDGGVALAGSASRASIELHGTTLPVRIVTPAFYRRLTTSKRPMAQVGSVHGPFVAINVAAACSVGLRGAPCRYCRIGTPVPASEAFPMSIGDVVETVRAAFDEGFASAVYFNTGYLGGDDGGIAFLEPYIRAVKRNFATLVAVQLHPPRTHTWIDRAYAMGVDALGFGVEVHDAAVLQRLCAGRVRFIGRERYYEALAYAASIFPRGTVWSELLLGAEPVESTRRAIDLLTHDSVLPMLSILPASNGRIESEHGTDELEQRIELCRYMYHAARSTRIPIGWLRTMGYAVTPYEARLLADPSTQISGAENYLYAGPWARFTTRTLSRFRRRLRVRQVTDLSLEDHS